MSLVRYWFLRSLRARARSYVGLAVLLALLGGLTLASFAGARRTASAYPRFREAGGALDLQMNSGGFEAAHPEVAGQMPGVTASATYMAFLAGPVTPDGRPDVSATGEVVGSLDGLDVWPPYLTKSAPGAHVDPRTPQNSARIPKSPTPRREG